MSNVTSGINTTGRNFYVVTLCQLGEAPIPFIIDCETWPTEEQVVAALGLEIGNGNEIGINQCEVTKINDADWQTDAVERLREKLTDPRR